MPSAPRRRNPLQSSFSGRTSPNKCAMWKKPIASETQSGPLRAIAVDIAVTHGPQKGKATVRVPPTQDRIFWGRALDRTVARNYPIRRTTARQGRNNALPWANQIIGEWFSQLHCFFPSWLSPGSLWQLSGQMCLAFFRCLESANIRSRDLIYCFWHGNRIR